ncbi:ParB/RepB/Spo0J family partition protein [Marivivens marinus]|uniref:ParB/RepB/Spo0J family partition protein n=1 Tax=Marivivens marinus TaxID=3110173 RepID=UPI003B8474AA
MAEKTNRNRGLGRGLSALMSDVTATSDANPAAPAKPDQMVPVDRIRPNPDQPRRSFNQDALEELAASIREKGVIQPLIVRTDPKDPALFEIVAGERRWRASQIAKRHEVPVIVREFTDSEVLEVAIVENIQRADLNPIDEAAGYRQLIDRFGHTQEQLASALGKSRSHITNLMRLLTLPQAVQTHVVEGRMSAGHARALIGRDDAEALARKVIAEGLSVREVEKLVKAPTSKRPAQNRSSGPARKDPDTIQIEKELGATLKMDVSIDHAEGQESGKLTLRYKSLEQLDDLLRLLSGG